MDGNTLIFTNHVHTHIYRAERGGERWVARAMIASVVKHEKVEALHTERLKVVKGYYYNLFIYTVPQLSIPSVA